VVSRSAANLCGPTHTSRLTRRSNVVTSTRLLRKKIDHERRAEAIHPSAARATCSKKDVISSLGPRLTLTVRPRARPHRSRVLDPARYVAFSRALWQQSTNVWSTTRSNSRRWSKTRAAPVGVRGGRALAEFSRAPEARRPSRFCALLRHRSLRASTRWHGADLVSTGDRCCPTRGVPHTFHRRSLPPRRTPKPPASASGPARYGDGRPLHDRGRCTLVDAALIWLGAVGLVHRRGSPSLAGVRSRFARPRPLFPSVGRLDAVSAEAARVRWPSAAIPAELEPVVASSTAAGPSSTGVRARSAGRGATEATRLRIRSAQPRG